MNKILNQPTSRPNPRGPPSKIGGPGSIPKPLSNTIPQPIHKPVAIQTKNKEINLKELEKAEKLESKEDSKPIQDRPTGEPVEISDQKPITQDQNKSQILNINNNEDSEIQLELPDDPQNSAIEGEHEYKLKYEKIKKPLENLMEFQENFKQNAETSLRASSLSHDQIIYQEEKDESQLLVEKSNFSKNQNYDMDQNKNIQVGENLSPLQNALIIGNNDEDDTSQVFQQNAPPIEFVSEKKQVEEIEINQILENQESMKHNDTLNSPKANEIPTKTVENYDNMDNKLSYPIHEMEKKSDVHNNNNNEIEEIKPDNSSKAGGIIQNEDEIYGIKKSIDSHEVEWKIRYNQLELELQKERLKNDLINKDLNYSKLEIARLTSELHDALIIINNNKKKQDDSESDQRKNDFNIMRNELKNYEEENRALKDHLNYLMNENAKFKEETDLIIKTLQDENKILHHELMDTKAKINHQDTQHVEILKERCTMLEKENERMNDLIQCMEETLSQKDTLYDNLLRSKSNYENIMDKLAQNAYSSKIEQKFDLISINDYDTKSRIRGHTEFDNQNENKSKHEKRDSIEENEIDMEKAAFDPKQQVHHIENDKFIADRQESSQQNEAKSNDVIRSEEDKVNLNDENNFDKQVDFSKKIELVFENIKPRSPTNSDFGSSSLMQPGQYRNLTKLQNQKKQKESTHKLLADSNMPPNLLNDSSHLISTIPFEEIKNNHHDKADKSLEAIQEGNKEDIQSKSKESIEMTNPNKSIDATYPHAGVNIPKKPIVQKATNNTFTADKLDDNFFNNFNSSQNQPFNNIQVQPQNILNKKNNLLLKKNESSETTNDQNIFRSPQLSLNKKLDSNTSVKSAISANTEGDIPVLTNPQVGLKKKH